MRSAAAVKLSRASWDEPDNTKDSEPFNDKGHSRVTCGNVVL